MLKNIAIITIFNILLEDYREVNFFASICNGLRENVGFDTNPTCKGLFGLFKLNEIDFSQLGILSEQFLYFSIQFSFIG